MSNSNSKTDRVVCIIEDDAAVRSSLTALLEPLDCHVRAFASAEDFLANEHVTQLDFLIVDVRLPGMSGLELLEQIAFHKPLPALLVMTGHADAQEIKLNYWPNKTWFLVKPCDPSKLLAAISECLFP